MPSDTNEQSSSELELINNSVYSGQPVGESGPVVDPSWFAVAKSGVGCVLCTIRGFQLQCMRSSILSSGSSSVIAKESKDKEAPYVDRAVACKKCGLQYDWHKLDMQVSGRADDRLLDNELVRVARMVALWKDMMSAGALIGNLDAKQIGAACIWLETGEQGTTFSKQTTQNIANVL